MNQKTKLKGFYDTEKKKKVNPKIYAKRKGWTRNIQNRIFEKKKLQAFGISELRIHKNVISHISAKRKCFYVSTPSKNHYNHNFQIIHKSSGYKAFGSSFLYWVIFIESIIQTSNLYLGTLIHTTNQFDSTNSLLCHTIKKCKTSFTWLEHIRKRIDEVSNPFWKY